MRKLSIFAALLLNLALIVAFPAGANPPPVPSIPPQHVIDSVVDQTGGADFTPIGVTSSVLNQAYAFGGVFSGVRLKKSQAVHYITTAGKLRETVIPIRGLRDDVLDPDMTAPGSEPRPGKIIGVVHQPARDIDVMWVVAIFKPDAAQCPSCDPPEKIRFYYATRKYFEYSIVWGEFLDENGDQMVDPVDKGAVIAHKRSCITVGLEQACWEPYSYSKVRQEPLPKDMAYDAYTEFKDLFDLQVDFYVDDAVPDLLGQTLRNNCALYMSNATSFNNMTPCRPNVVITAAKSQASGQPIAILVVTQTADIRTYDTSGAYVGGLPVGAYLVINTNETTTPGMPTALFLVGMQAHQRYLI